MPSQLFNADVRSMPSHLNIADARCGVLIRRPLALQIMKADERSTMVVYRSWVRTVYIVASNLDIPYVGMLARGTPLVARNAGSTGKAQRKSALRGDLLQNSGQPTH